MNILFSVSCKSTTLQYKGLFNVSINYNKYKQLGLYNNILMLNGLWFEGYIDNKKPMSFDAQLT